MREHREQTDQVEPPTLDLGNRQRRQGLTGRVVKVVVRVKVKELEARIRNARLKEIDDRVRDIDTHVMLDRNSTVQKRLREPNATTEVEHVEPTKVAHPDVPRHVIDQVDGSVDDLHRVADGIAAQFGGHYEFVHPHM